MSDGMRNDHEPWSARTKAALVGFSLVGGFFLVTEHWAHVVSYLPWVLLAACPLMHLFMHGGHNHDDRNGHRRGTDDAARADDVSASEGKLGSFGAGALGRDGEAPSIDHTHRRGGGRS